LSFSSKGSHDVKVIIRLYPPLYFNVQHTTASGPLQYYEMVCLSSVAMPTYIK